LQKSKLSESKYLTFPFVFFIVWSAHDKPNS